MDRSQPGERSRPGVWVLEPDSLADVLDKAAKSEETVVVLDTADVADRDGLFDAVRKQLPQDPPLGTFRDVWDAMADSLFGGFDGLAPAITLVWKGSQRLRSEAPDDYYSAIAILRDLTVQLADPDTANGRATLLRVVVV